VAPCAICIVHVEMKSAGFLVEPQNQGRRFVSALASKPLGQFLIGLDLKTGYELSSFSICSTVQTSQVI
jgi:hypothetical protein